jgi:hypothetical protein
LLPEPLTLVSIAHGRSEVVLTVQPVKSPVSKPPLTTMLVADRSEAARAIAKKRERERDFFTAFLHTVRGINDLATLAHNPANLQWGLALRLLSARREYAV